MADIKARLARLGSTIERLMALGGTPGLALGVFAENEPGYFANYGFRDVEKQLPVTEDTVFPVCSRKGSHRSGDGLVKDVIPDFQSSSAMLQENTTLSDILCHRTGMGWADNLICGTGNLLLNGRELMRFVNHRPLQCPFRAQFGYNNLHFEMAGQALEHLSGQSYVEFVKERLFKPLGMDRSFLTTPPNDVDPTTVTYNALDDATAAPINFFRMGDDGYGAPSGGMRSTVRDLAKLYKAFLRGLNDDFDGIATSSDDCVLKQLTHIMSGKIAMDQPSKHETSYAFGWARVQLPGRMGQIGLNPGLLPEGMPMPLVGKGTSSLVFFHQGSLPGALAFAALLPEIEAAVIVLTNSLALTDVADWVGQLVIEELLDVAPDARNDFEKLAETTVAENLKWYPTVVDDLKREQKTGTSPKPLEQYVGRYWDHLHIFMIELVLEGDQLSWLIQGLETEKFELDHYQDDTFTWLSTRNELSKRGRWVGNDQEASFWKVEFGVDGNGQVDKLTWAHDAGVPAITFTKT